MSYRGAPFDEEYFNGGRGYGYSHYTQTIKSYVDVVADDIDFEFDGVFNKGLKALDVGCGTGVLVDELNRRGLDTDGLDISSYAIDEARILYPSWTFFNEDIIGNSLANNTYDIIIAIGLLGCATNRPKADDMIAEIKRVGNPFYKSLITFNAQGGTYLNFSFIQVDGIKNGSFPSKDVTITDLVDSGIEDDEELIARTSLGSFGWKLVVK